MAHICKTGVAHFKSTLNLGDGTLVAEVQFFVVTEVEVNLAESVAGVSELLHRQLGGFVVNLLVEELSAVPLIKLLRNTDFVDN